MARLAGRSSPSRGLWPALLGLAALILGAAWPAAADEPGRFDFYVLSLSWTPSYCEDEGRNDRSQCGARPYAFVVHGLWPQNERGFPDYCDAGVEPGRADIAAALALTPSEPLIRHEWRRHGTCSGLTPAAYFATAAEAWREITIPAEYRGDGRIRRVSPNEVEAAFRAVNPGLDADEIAMTCRGGRLREVRICFTRDLEFRACEEIDRQGCRANRVTMPAVR